MLERLSIPQYSSARIARDSAGSENLWVQVISRKDRVHDCNVQLETPLRRPLNCNLLLVDPESSETIRRAPFSIADDDIVRAAWRHAEASGNDWSSQQSF